MGRGLDDLFTRIVARGTVVRTLACRPEQAIHTARALRRPSRQPHVFLLSCHEHRNSLF